MRPLTKTLLGGAAALIAAGVALTPPAQAACQWDGNAWSCQPSATTAATPPSYIPAPSWGFTRPDYSRVWNENPGPKAAYGNQQ